MLKILMVGIGGFAGSICRYLIYEATLFLYKGAWFPLGTLTVNISGCFFIGFLGGLSEIHEIFTPEIRALVFIGFLGGFTTFASFGYEVFFLARNGQTGAAFVNMSLQVILGLTAVWAGFALSKFF
ncbi:MAG: fluoride efflux transporter CrcB [Desulfobacteraceae bacterium]|nr:fluoride efflux transporter CrcB [Desulfobacteraceae bacterium]